MEICVRKIVTSATVMLIVGCGLGSDEADQQSISAATQQLISADVELDAPAPQFDFGSPYQSTMTATVKLRGLVPGASGTITYSLGRQAYRHPYFSRTDVRTVTLEPGMTEVTDSVSTICTSTRLPYTWYITGTLTTSTGTVAIQGARTGARCK